MIKISEAVSDIIQGDEISLEALRAGVLNFSAYARKIKTFVEQKLYKEVQTGSIVTALSRIAPRVKNIPPLRPKIQILDMSIKSPLSEITFEKTEESLKNVSKLMRLKSTKGKFFTITQGITEITIIAPSEIKREILDHLIIKPKGQYDNLVAITASFVEQEYIEVPNMIYALVAALAIKRINLIEIVSTYTEISFIVRQKDMRNTIDVLKEHFLNN